MQIGETKKTDKCTMNRSFGCLTLTVSSNVDVGIVFENICGKSSMETYSQPGGLALEIESRFPGLDESWLEIAVSRLFSLGILSVLINEQKLYDHADYNASLHEYINKLVKIIDDSVNQPLNTVT